MTRFNTVRPRTLALSTLAALVALAGYTTAAAQAASPAWRALAATGPTNLEPYVNDRQNIRVAVGGGSGTFSLTFGGSTTVAMPFDASPGTVEAALNALPSISAGGGSVSVTGGVGDPGGARPYVVEFDGGPLAGTAVGPITNGGTTGNATVSIVPTPTSVLKVLVTNIGGAATSGTVSVTVGPLPSGVETSESATGAGWSCLPSGEGQTTVTCTRSATVQPFTPAVIMIPLQTKPGAPASSTVPVTVSGGGAAHPDTYHALLTVSDQPVHPGIQAFWAGAFDSNGQPYTQAGGHPHSAQALFLVNTNRQPNIWLAKPVGETKDVVFDLPAGFVGNPLASARCPQTINGGCNNASETDIGHNIAMVPVFDNVGSAMAIHGIEPVDGYAAQFTFPVLDTRVTALASLRSDTDYGVTVTAPNIVPFYKVFGNYIALDGAAAAANGKAFFTNPTDCPGSVLPTLLSKSTWQAGNVFSQPVASDSPPTTGCGLVPFDPSMTVEPTVSGRDAASGLAASIDLPQDGLLDPNAIATSHLKKTVVELPAGLSVNPSGATGLRGCTDAQIAIGSKAKPSCPDASKLGTVRVTSPLVDQALDGVMYLGTPKSTDPMSGEMLRLFLVVRNDRYGILVKLPGSTTADPQTGRLTATFDNNPRLPFDHLEVKIRGGAKGLLATPQDCGQVESVSTLSPWSGNADEERPTPFTVGGSCGLGFAPKLAAGMSTQAARANGSFSFKFSRRDGEQWIDGLTARLPQGLLASVRGFPLCSSGLAATGSCPESSRIGTVDATAGTGDPFVLERKGSAYLTEGYKGCAYGLVVKVPVVAGPFDKSSPATDLGDIVVRQAVCVDRSTAEVSAISDPLPTIWHGIPIRMRSVTVVVDRPGFMLNPSHCSPKQVGGVFRSNRGGSASAVSAFNNTGCSSLAFAPKLTLGLTGRNQVRTGKHPGVRAQVVQRGVSEAGIEKAVVRLPKSLALDVNNAQALCEYADGIKPDLENHCPKGSIIGRARAKTPLLNNDLAGDVYFVKNVRIDPRTGNTIRTLPMLVVALRGEIAINLRGVSSTTRDDRLVNTFAAVPDAPITRFNMNIKGGRNGILAVTRTRRALINLCAKPRSHVAETDIDGHNGRRYDRDIRMRTPCTRRQIKQARNAAKRAQAQRATARKGAARRG